MTEQIGFLSLDGTADSGRAPIPAEEAPGIGIGIARDGADVLARRLRPSAPQLYLAPVDGGVLWGTDLAAVVAARAERGLAPAPHEPTVLAYLRGQDVASGSATFFEGVQRLDVGDRVRIGADGAIRRERGEEAADAGHGSLAQAVRAAVGTAEQATVLLAEDLGSAALLVESDAARAVTVHAASARAADGAASPVGVSRALEAVATRAGIAHESVRPSTDQFKKDLADLVRTQGEPFAGLGVYAHFVAVRRAAETGGPGAAVIDATGPRGAGFIGAASLPQAAARREGLLPGAVDRARRTLAARRRRALDVDALLQEAFVEATAASGQRPAADRADRDAAAVVAARRNAARFGVDLRLPLLDPAVRAALRPAAGADPAAAAADPASALRALGSLANPSAAATEPEALAAIDQDAWTGRLKGMLHQVFRSEQFARRPWNDQRAVLEAFEEHIAGRTDGGADVFWRLFLLELWMREVVERDPSVPAPEAGVAVSLEDDHGRFDEPEPKDPLAANAGKQLDLELADAEGGTIARRYPIRTDKFAADTPMDPEISRYVAEFFTALDAALEGEGPEVEDHRAATVGHRWNLTVSEKIIAIMQGRSYFVWDVKPTWWATTLSRYVARTPAGIGLGDPVTMQLAIQEAGLPRVLLASAAGAAGKVLGRKGLFYQVVGGNVRAIDGPTEYSVYPANVSAKLPPKDPDAVAEHLNAVIREVVPERWRDAFAGTVVMDANDIGRNTLGKAAPLSAEHYELQFADNPLGQGREQTPMAIVFER